MPKIDDSKKSHVIYVKFRAKNVTVATLTKLSSTGTNALKLTSIPKPMRRLNLHANFSLTIRLILKKLKFEQLTTQKCREIRGMLYIKKESTATNTRSDIENLNAIEAETCMKFCYVQGKLTIKIASEQSLLFVQRK